MATWDVVRRNSFTAQHRPVHFPEQTAAHCAAALCPQRSGSERSEPPAMHAGGEGIIAREHNSARRLAVTATA